EPLESWRIFFLDRYQELASRMSNPSDPLEAAKLINEDLKQLFGFDPRYYCHPTDQGLTEMLENNLGRCEDMTNIAIYAFRANGLPLTSDYTPHWADTSNNHAWNALITPSGEAIPMMGCEANPGEYSLRPIIAKVYRKTFSINEDNLIFQLKQGEKAPPWLSGKNYCDVTNLYVATHDINLQVDPLFSDEDSFIYLCVFNSGEWKAIHWAELQNGKAKFTKMGTEICYLPMFYREEQLQPATIPFILRADGELDWIEASSIKDDLLLVSVTKKIIQASTDDKIVSSLQKDSEYELFYWNDRWESLGKRTADEKPLKYERVPGTALYWLVQCNSNKEERIFTYENNTQIWW
ncbi:MAG: transglutaminase domain-containing protein, partial [Candidatus Cloacimonetes bacterium]|nr:transglutaminase domain-containing protein [Candidatus Cloacimonadota bacterium]